MDIRNVPNKGKKKVVGTPVSHIVPSVEPKKPIVAEADVEEVTEEVPGEDTVIATMRKELEKEGYTDQVYFSLLDAVMTGEEYTWDFSLLGTIPCKFRIRPDWVNQMLVKKMETDSPKTIARFTDMLNRFNLAGSILNFGENTFALEEEESVDDILKYLGSLPFVIINALISELVIFDKVTSVAMSPWAIKNFIKPQSEK